MKGVPIAMAAMAAGGRLVPVDEARREAARNKPEDPDGPDKIRGLEVDFVAYDELPEGAFAVLGHPEAVGYPGPPIPDCLTSDPNHPDYHPACRRVGLLINGEVCRDVIWFDARALLFRTLSTGMKGEPLSASEILPFWKEPESRQQRRARERWESNHPKRL